MLLLKILQLIYLNISGCLLFWRCALLSKRLQVWCFRWNLSKTRCYPMEY